VFSSQKIGCKEEPQCSYFFALPFFLLSEFIVNVRFEMLADRE
jgi:hypothetical protein